MACEYCSDKEDKRIIENSSLRVVVDDLTKKLFVNYYDQFWQLAYATINYCPMCGRDLRETDCD